MAEITHQTLVGLRTDMTISGEQVAIEGVLGKDFFLQLSKEAKLGTPISFAYWLNSVYAVDSDGIRLLMLKDYKDGDEFLTAYNADKTKPPAQRVIPQKIKENLRERGLPEAVHNIMVTALTAELSVTDLLIQIKKDDSQGERKKLKFGLAITFPNALQLLPNINVDKLSLLIMHAPTDDFTFPPRPKELGEPTPLKEKASGYIDFADNPEDTGTITLGGTVWKFVKEEPKALETKIGSKLDDTLTALAADLNRWESPEKVKQCTYTADLDAHRLNIEFKEGGLDGNDFTLATDDKSKGTVSSATLLGGTDPSAPKRLAAPPAKRATGSITFKRKLREGDKITLNGVDFIFKDQPAGDNELKADEIDPALDALVEKLGKSDNAKLKICKYEADKPGKQLKITAEESGDAVEFTLGAGPTASLGKSGDKLEVPA